MSPLTFVALSHRCQNISSRQPRGNYENHKHSAKKYPQISKDENTKWTKLSLLLAGVFLNCN